MPSALPATPLGPCALTKIIVRAARNPRPCAAGSSARTCRATGVSTPLPSPQSDHTDTTSSAARCKFLHVDPEHAEEKTLGTEAFLDDSDEQGLEVVLFTDSHNRLYPNPREALPLAD